MTNPKSSLDKLTAGATLLDQAITWLKASGLISKTDAGHLDDVRARLANKLSLMQKVLTNVSDPV